MPVVNVAPTGVAVTIHAGQVPGQINVYNTGQPNPENTDTDYGYQIGPGPVVIANLAPGGTQTYPVNWAQFRIENYGPSVLQLLY